MPTHATVTNDAGEIHYLCKPNTPAKPEIITAFAEEPTCRVCLRLLRKKTKPEPGPENTNADETKA